MKGYDAEEKRELDSELDFYIAAPDHKLCGNNLPFPKKVMAVTYCTLAGTPCTVQICPNYLVKQVKYLARNGPIFTGPISCKSPCSRLKFGLHLTPCSRSSQYVVSRPNRYLLSIFQHYIA